MKFIRTLCAVCCLAPAIAMSAPQTTAFTYQGHLLQSGAPTSGTHNLTFTLWDSVSGGSQVGSSITQNNYPVAEGLFNIDLDFGAAVFNGQQRFLDVKIDGTDLTPRQPINSSPTAIYALSSANGMSVTGSTSTQQFTNDRLFAGVGITGNGSVMVLTAKPAFNPAGTTTVAGHAGGVDVFSSTSALTNSIVLSGTSQSVNHPELADARMLIAIDPAYGALGLDLAKGTVLTNLQVDVIRASDGAVTASFCYGSVAINGLTPMPQAGIAELTITAAAAGARIFNVSSGGTTTSHGEFGYNFRTGMSTTDAPCIN